MTKKDVISNNRHGKKTIIRLGIKAIIRIALATWTIKLRITLTLTNILRHIVTNNNLTITLKTFTTTPRMTKLINKKLNDLWE